MGLCAEVPGTYKIEMQISVEPPRNQIKNNESRDRTIGNEIGETKQDSR